MKGSDTRECFIFRDGFAVTFVRIENVATAPCMWRLSFLVGRKGRFPIVFVRFEMVVLLERSQHCSFGDSKIPGQRSVRPKQPCSVKRECSPSGSCTARRSWVPFEEECLLLCMIIQERGAWEPGLNVIRSHATVVAP